MKTMPFLDPLVAQDSVRPLAPVKVCMHVVKIARAEGRVMRDANAFVEAGFEVTIVDVESERTRPVEEDIRGIHMKHLILPGWFTSRHFELLFFLKALHMFILSLRLLLRIPADIYHASDLTALPASYIAARLRQKPLIFEAHELHFPVPETEISFWRLLGGILIHLLVMILPGCAGVITVSPPIAEEMRKRYHIPEVTLIRNVPPYRVVAKSDRLRQHLGLGPEVRIALYQGNLQHNRGLDKLIQAAAFLEPGIVIVMMGQDMEGTQAELEALIVKEGVSDRVKIIPAVPYEELLDWTSSADIGLTILPLDYSLSIRLCLPNKLFEYLMAGLPVLTSELDAITTVVKTYDVGQVVSSLAPADVGAAINAMLADPQALARMHRNALEAAQEEFHWEKESQRLIHLYRDVLTRWQEERETGKVQGLL